MPRRMFRLSPSTSGRSFGEVVGGDPGGEAGGDGEVVVGALVLGLGAVAGKFEEFLFEYLPSFEADFTFERVGGSEKLERRNESAEGETDVAAGEGVGAFAAGDDYGLDGHAIGQVAAQAIDDGRAGAAGDPIEIERGEGGVFAALAEGEVRHWAGVSGGVPDEAQLTGGECYGHGFPLVLDRIAGGHAWGESSLARVDFWC